MKVHNNLSWGTFYPDTKQSLAEARTNIHFLWPAYSFIHWMLACDSCVPLTQVSSPEMFVHPRPHRLCYAKKTRVSGTTACNKHQLTDIPIHIQLVWVEARLVARKVILRDPNYTQIIKSCILVKLFCSFKSPKNSYKSWLRACYL